MDILDMIASTHATVHVMDVMQFLDRATLDVCQAGRETTV